MAAGIVAVVEARIFLEMDMTQPELLRLGGGDVAVYSKRSPAKETPSEDGAAVLQVGAARGVLAVADGLGGRPQGGDASKIAIRCLKAAATRLGEDEDTETALRSVILDGIESANAKVRELGTGAATTIAVVELDGRTMRPYHVGDSTILVVGQRGRIKTITIAHSPVGYAVEAGLLDATEAMHHEERHLISNMVGTSDMRIEIGSPLDLASRDTLLLATDGLADNVTLDEIVGIIRSGPLAAAARRLVELASRRMNEPREGEPSKMDDLTFLLFRPLASGRRSGGAVAAEPAVRARSRPRRHVPRVTRPRRPIRRGRRASLQLRGR